MAQLKWAAAIYLHGQLPWGNVNSVCHSSSFSRENVNLVGFFVFLVKYSDIYKKRQSMYGHEGHHVQLGRLCFSWGS